MSIDLNELADRVERTTADEQGSMILLALEAAFPKPPSDYQPRREPNFSPEWSAWAKLDAKVRNFVQRGAFLDAATSMFAADTMYRSGHSALAPDPSMFFCDAVTADGDSIHALARTEANARLAAALRTKALGAVHTLEGGL